MVAEKYRFTDISQNIKEIKYAINEKALKNRSRIHLLLKKILNVDSLWKYQNHKKQIIGAKIKSKENLKRCLAILQTLPTETAVIYKIMTIKEELMILSPMVLYLPSFHFFKSL